MNDTKYSTKSYISIVITGRDWVQKQKKTMFLITCILNTIQKAHNICDPTAQTEPH